MRWLRNLLFRRSRERDLDDELASFLELAADAKQKQGLGPAEARRAARLTLGGTEPVRERVREAWAGASIDTFLRDLCYGVRTLRRDPAFTAIAVVTLALGIGANTAIFSLVHGVLLSPLPYADADQLALVWWRFDAAGQSRNPASGPELEDLRARARLLDGVAGIWSSTGALTGDGDPEQIRVGCVTPDFFDVLGALPAEGRSFVDEEEGRAEGGAIVLSDGLWRRRYAANPTLVGKTILVDGAPTTVVGVMPPGFELRFPEGSGVPGRIQAWLPFRWQTADMPRDLSFIRVLARMKDDVTLWQVRDEATQIATDLRREFARYQEVGLGLDVVPLQEDVVRDVRPALLALFGGVGLLLLIACVNVAHLQLGRFAARRREIALRAALGASRLRIARQLLIESVTLALIGGAAGTLLGAAALEMLLVLRPAGLESLAGHDLSLPVLGFTFAVSLVTGVLFGLAPVFESSRIPVLATLARGGRGAGAPLPARLRLLLVVAEFAFGFVLLIGAGLMIRTLLQTMDAHPGFQANGALTFQVSLPRARYADDPARSRFAEELAERLGSLPGVRAVGASSHLPLDDYPNWYGFVWPDDATDEQKTSLLADQRAVTPDFLRALRTERIEGRLFRSSDRQDTRLVAIVDEMLARALWPGESAIGRGLNLEAWDNGEFVARRAEVVGVVRHVQQHGLTSRPRGQAYLPHAQGARPVLSWVVRTEGDPTRLSAAVAAEVSRLDPDLPIAKVQPLAAYIDRASAAARFTAVLSGVFAVVALLLASVGIYGVLGYAVEQRRYEIGVRLAMGARAGQVLRLIVGRGLQAAVTGLGLGVIGAIAIGRFLAGLLYGVGPTDPPTFVGVGILLLLVAFLASWLPARRAARVDPSRCLRSE